MCCMCIFDNQKIFGAFLNGDDTPNWVWGSQEIHNLVHFEDFLDDFETHFWLFYTFLTQRNTKIGKSVHKRGKNRKHTSSTNQSYSKIARNIFLRAHTKKYTTCTRPSICHQNVVNLIFIFHAFPRNGVQFEVFVKRERFFGSSSLGKVSTLSTL